MTWNYRIIKTHSTYCGESYQIYTVNEVYYDKQGKVDGHTSDGISPSGETLDELKSDLENYKKAFDKPAIIYDNDTNEYLGEETPT